MKTFSLDTELWLPRPRAEVFPFFARARNLEDITPPWLRFEVVAPPGEISMGVGTLIDYRIKLRGIPIRWRTKITQWQPPELFTDVQLRGPYSLWEHTHTFVEQAGGTLCRDHVRYRPFGGALMNRLFVRRDIEKIFAFRQQRLKELFPPRASS